uniref:C2H2-type domain-containing protein n=1 Tax=Acrobeloides nanus TaxID=290746 RepID=A0A914EBW7_9BILA
MNCRLVFANPDLQREHYRSEWHRYNVKRQVAELPPISLEQFHDKVQLYHQQSTVSKAATSQEDLYCPACGKSFRSKNSFENHINSKKHKENYAVFETKEDTNLSKPEKVPSIEKATEKSEPLIIPEEFIDPEGYNSSDWETVDDEEEENEDMDIDESKALPPTSCLFCSENSSTVEENVLHMGQKHGFFIPDAEFCCDVEGLLTFLGMKVGCGNICIWCNKRSKKFRSLDACQKHMRDLAHCRFSIDEDKIVEFLDFYDYSSLVPEDGTENDDVAIDEGYSLVLPSGARIGHRSLMRYYRQSLNPITNQSAVKNRKAINFITSQYKALGWTGATGQVAVQKARDVKFMKKITSKYMLRQGIKANKLFKSRGRDDQ